MNLAQALEHANALAFPGFLTDDGALTDERRKNEEAISLLVAAWMGAEPGQEPFSWTAASSSGSARTRDASS